MSNKSGRPKDVADKLVGGIKRKAHKHYLAEVKIRIVPLDQCGDEAVLRTGDQVTFPVPEDGAVLDRSGGSYVSPWDGQGALASLHLVPE